MAVKDVNEDGRISLVQLLLIRLNSIIESMTIDWGGSWVDEALATQV